MMETKYEEGVWYAWNGGTDCPINLQSEVQVIWYNPQEPEKVQTDFGKADDFLWITTDFPVVAFRITKLHKEPREWWIVPDEEMSPQFAEPNEVKPWSNAVRVREVMEGDE